MKYSLFLIKKCHPLLILYLLFSVTTMNCSAASDDVTKELRSQLKIKKETIQTMILRKQEIENHLNQNHDLYKTGQAQINALSSGAVIIPGLSLSLDPPTRSAQLSLNYQILSKPGSIVFSPNPALNHAIRELFKAEIQRIESILKQNTAGLNTKLWSSQQLQVLQEDSQIYEEYLKDILSNLSQLQRDTEYLEKQIKLAKNLNKTKGLYPLKGRLPPPVEGRLIQLYGTAGKHPQARMNQSHGIMVLTAADAPVFAVAPGKVVFADVVSEPGKLVIIDHGKETYSIYGGLKNTDVVKGSFVDEADLLGQAGEDSVTRQFQIHFELHVDGIALNPLKWLKKNSYSH
ncbi:MAG: peptidoglycan DD-metalloendopeptidase family protein [SAR324 cluster bacterium]|nr:peptidoglycan DD-metalloendopeptidase family protein [SAR324 cluster bacterium]